MSGKDREDQVCLVCPVDQVCEVNRTQSRQGTQSTPKVDQVCQVYKVIKVCQQGRTEKLKGGGRILRKMNSCCEILNKMSQKGEGAKGRRPPLLITPMCTYAIKNKPIR